MWVKSRKVGHGKRQQRWDNGPLAMHEREAQRQSVDFRTPIGNPSSAMGSIDRVTGSLWAITRIWDPSTHSVLVVSQYLLKCRPAQRMF